MSEFHVLFSPRLSHSFHHLFSVTEVCFPFLCGGSWLGCMDLPWSLLSSLCHPCTHHCAIPSPITVPSLLSSLFRPCSYYFAIPALINNARVYASITVPSPLSSLWPRSLLSSLCHPHSHHCAIPSCYFIDSTLLDHTDDTPFWTWFTKS